MSPTVVLCVDDRPDWLKLRKSVLETLGYYVVTATDAPTAITILEALPVDVVLLEYKCEGFDAVAGTPVFCMSTTTAISSVVYRSTALRVPGAFSTCNAHNRAALQ
jgi:CheY-like chemotaxis protein